MKRMALALVTLAVLVGTTHAQGQRHHCHVYVVDVAAAQKAAALDDEQAMIKASQAAQSIFPEFSPDQSEEALTTKHYGFPGAKQVISASVYYTDESMASSVGRDSIVLGVLVGPREVADALAPQAGTGSIAEASLGNNAGKVRAKQYVTVNGKLYLIGIECDCGQPTPSTP